MIFFAIHVLRGMEKESRKEEEDEEEKMEEEEEKTKVYRLEIFCKRYECSFQFLKKCDCF